jgi:hypothetical protein
MRYRTSVTSLALALLVGACGNGASDDPEREATETSDASAGTTVTAGEPENSTETESAQSTAAPEPEAATATGSGTANLTIGDTTVEFTGLTCYFDAEAAEVHGDDDAIFAALAQDGDTILLVSIRDQGIELFEVAYLPGDGSGNRHMISTGADPSYLVEDGRITAEGEFDLIVDSAESGTEFGTLEATCG